MRHCQADFVNDILNNLIEGISSLWMQRGITGTRVTSLTVEHCVFTEFTQKNQVPAGWLLYLRVQFTSIWLSPFNALQMRSWPGYWYVVQVYMRSRALESIGLVKSCRGCLNILLILRHLLSMSSVLVDTGWTKSASFKTIQTHWAVWAL